MLHVLTLCRICHQLKPRARFEKDYRGKYVYRDDEGNRWQGLRCHECSKKSKIEWGRSNGSRPIDEVNSHCQKIGRLAEIQAKEHFESLGYAVRLTRMHGPDLVIEKDGALFSVEVKTAVRVKGRNCWYVNGIMEKRTSDDLIAIVFRDSHVVVEPMRRHLEKCGLGRKRVVSGYADKESVQT